jgi:aminopeptidase N
VVATYQKFLPDFPWRELELFQAPDGVMGYVWIAPHGMVNLQSVRVFSSVSGGGSPFREGTPHMESGVLAHEIAHQYWGHTIRASHMSEGWVNETFSETFASLYTGLAYGDNDFESRMDGYRATWEEDVPKDMAHAPLLRAYEDRRLQPRIVYNYGPYVMHRMLRRRIGDAAFFGALDVYAREHYRQWADARQLLATFQSATEADLTDFFDFWVYGGRIPAVTLTWSLQDDNTVQGTITSDVPFGTFDVPVVVRGKKGKPQELMVVVTDGEGTFTTGTVPGGKVKKVELDPNGWILATDRKVKQVRN